MNRLKWTLVAAVLGFCVLDLCSASPVENVVDGSSRIINGQPGSNTEFRYAASLQAVSHSQQMSRGHSCGGVLITFQHVLTSGSCLYTVNALGVYLPKLPGAYRVFAGAASLHNDTTDRWRSISAMNAHPDYIGPPSTFNDIGIITLLSAFLNTSVVPLPLSATAAPPDFTPCFAAGWGAADFQESANTQLMYASKYVYNTATCAAVLNPQPSAPNVLPLHICAASYTFAASCRNDTGNALVCGGVLTGVLSWHPPCPAQTSWPDLYTRTANYSTWIREVTGAGDAASPPALLVLLCLSAVLARVCWRYVDFP